MRIQDLHELPKFRDGLSYLYLEHGRIDQAQKAIEFFDKEGRVMVPAAALAVLLLGPGTAITHEAVKTLVDNGCLINWVGEQGVRFYAQGCGETRKGYRLLRQAELVCDSDAHMEVVRRMYQFRFDFILEPGLSIEQIRGYEGARVRKAYQEASRRFGVPWRGREYNRNFWQLSDPINRALSAANSCLNSLCHAAIVSGGYAPGLGFVHTGKQLSFVYDIADLYKMDLTVPLAFRMTAESDEQLETRVRYACRELFHAEHLMGRIIDDIDKLLDMPAGFDAAPADEEAGEFDSDPALPSGLWSPDGSNQAQGGINYGSDHT
jgi:CRISPR-associated protein Cas1